VGYRLEERPLRAVRLLVVLRLPEGFLVLRVRPLLVLLP
jgi:hypothetical protein